MKRNRKISTGHHALMTLDQILHADARYWMSRSIEERISAVETIRERMIQNYDPNARMDRTVIRFTDLDDVDIPPR